MVDIEIKLKKEASGSGKGRGMIASDREQLQTFEIFLSADQRDL